MDVNGRVVVVTGAAGGIGSALAERFQAAGARGVVVADVDAEGAATVASRLDALRPGSALATGCDVGTEAGNRELIATAEEAFGPVDLFFANAGIGTDADLDLDDEGWRQIIDVNVLAHVYAARLLVPGWVAREHGYFCSTASAAGLLTQIGDVAYAVTKHAAVAFAEWLSITYGDRGVRVSCLCPQGVNTRMLQGARLSGDVVKAAGRVLEPGGVADAVLEAVEQERFLILPHPEVQEYAVRRASDHERWLAGMRRLQARVLAT